MQIHPTLVLCVAMGLAAVGCSQDSNSGATTDAALAASDSTAAPTPGCTRIPLANDEEWQVSIAGTQRSFIVHIPQGYEQKPTPLVFNFHGYLSSNSEQVKFSQMNENSDLHNYIVVYPQGTGTPRGWNAGTCCGNAMENKTDELAFVKAMLSEVGDKLCVDQKRVYSTGYSNGGFLTNRLACEMSDVFAAISPVAGGNLMTSCEPTRPISVLHMHGDNDQVVPYKGSIGLGFPSVSESISKWALRNGCQGDPISSFDQGDAYCVAYQGCQDNSEVELCTVRNGGHTWPGGDAPKLLGYTSKDLNADERMWQFFSRHSLP